MLIISILIKIIPIAHFDKYHQKFKILDEIPLFNDFSTVPYVIILINLFAMITEFIKCLIILFVLNPLIKSHSQNADKKILDSLVSEYNVMGKCYGSVLIRKDGRIVYQGMMGFSDGSNAIKIKPYTVFMMGSISKTYTSLVIMKLVEQGLLNLNDRLSKFFPRVEKANDITIEMMLNHSSGLFDYSKGKETDLHARFGGKISKGNLLRIIEEYPIVFEPGSKNDYSNTNYILLGFIAESLTKKTMKQLIDKYIIEPLGLENTFYGRPPDRDNFAYSYTKQIGRYVPFLPSCNLDWSRSTGSISATLNDLATFYEALFSGVLIEKRYLERMLPKNDIDYGFGLMKWEYLGKTLYGYAGGIEGNSSNIAYNREDKLLIIMSLNAVGDVSPMELFTNLFSWSYNKPLINSCQEYRIVDKSILKTYKGTYYNDETSMEIRIFTQKRKQGLFAELEGLSVFPLEAYSEIEFVYKPLLIGIKFTDTNTNGTFLLKHNGTNFQFHRKKTNKN